jgi:hypothetical protein
MPTLTLLLLSSASRSYGGRGGPRVTIRRETRLMTHLSAQVSWYR